MKKDTSKKNAARRGTLPKVWRAIRRYRLLLILSLALAALTVALSLYIPVLVGDAIDEIIDALATADQAEKLKNSQ